MSYMFSVDRVRYLASYFANPPSGDVNVQHEASEYLKHLAELMSLPKERDELRAKVAALEAEIRARDEWNGIRDRMSKP